MAGGIAPVVLRVSADSAGLTAGMNSASRIMDNWATKTMAQSEKMRKKMDPSHNTKMAAGIMAGIGGAAGDIGDALKKAMGDPGHFLAENVIGGFGRILAMVPNVGPVIAAPFALLGGAMSFVMDQYEKGSEALLGLSKASERAGMSMNDMKVLMIAAGPAGAGTMDKSIMKLNQVILEAGRGSDEAKAKLAAFNVTAKDIGSKSTLDILKQIGGEFSKAGNSAVKMGALRNLAGKGAFELAPILSSPDKITRAQGTVEKYGLGGDTQTLAMVRSVKEAQKTMGYFSEGVTNGIMTGVAPILLTITEEMGQFGGVSKNVSAWVIDGFEFVAMSAAAVYTGFANLGLLGKTLWLGMRIGAEYVAVAIMEFGVGTLGVFDAIVKKIADVILWLMKIPGGGKLKGLLKGAGLDLEGMSKDGLGLSSGGIARHLKAGADEGRKMIAGDKQSLLNAWLAPTAMDKVKGFFEKVQANAVKQGTNVGDPLAEAMMKWKPRIMELQKELDGPLGAFRKDVMEITEIWATGLLSPIPEFQQQVMGMNFQKLASGMQMPEKRFAGAAAANSVEAYSAIVEHQYGDKQMSVQERMAAILQEQSARQLDQIRIGTELNALIAKDPTILRGLGA